MHLTLLTYGSRGDVQPLVALGGGLRQAGHRVRLAAPASFEGFVTGHGLEFAPLPGEPSDLIRRLIGRGRRNPFRALRAAGEQMIRLAAEIMAAVHDACQGTDAIVHSFLLTVAGHQAARALDVPDLSAQIIPIFTPTSAFPAPMFPPLPLGGRYNRLTHGILNEAFRRFNQLADRELRRRFDGAAERVRWPFGAQAGRPLPVLYGISPSVVPRPPDWGDNACLTGYWFLAPEAGWQPPADLLRFLEAGPPPVYIGFGSMIVRDAPRIVAVALEALRRSGERGVLPVGWGGLKKADLPEGVFAVDPLPHGWLFPRMAAVVHHGGAGTTAAGLRAGVPSILVPFMGDQFFWARRVAALGVGPPPIPRKELTADRLAYAIRLATTHRPMRGRAAALGERIRTEDGIGRAVSLIERHVRAG